MRYGLIGLLSWSHDRYYFIFRSKRSISVYHFYFLVLY